MFLNFNPLPFSFLSWEQSPYNQSIHACIRCKSMVIKMSKFPFEVASNKLDPCRAKDFGKWLKNSNSFGGQCVLEKRRAESPDTRVKTRNIILTNVENLLRLRNSRFDQTRFFVA
ncbi:hypothetical protein WH47_06669 [Habropoda laboriosa]|uniref:Uncharacterized protein n=1 Tax=Habropoda laboriosa TaxID=597456 RepID=A0A0L7QRY6_9HYME|nr:hypothetical protein WH47_06669 [Habropoda laboriosa]